MAIRRVVQSAVGCLCVGTALATNIQNVGLASTFTVASEIRVGNSIAVAPSGAYMSVGIALFSIASPIRQTAITNDLVCFDAAGNEQSYFNLNSSTAGNNQALYVVADAAGNYYVTGKQQGTGTDFDWYTFKVDKSGAIKWVQSVDGPGHKADTPCGIAVDTAGNCYVAGTVDADFSGSSRMAVVKYDSSGNVVWQNMAVTTDFSEGHAMCITPQGGVYIAGVDDSTGNFLVAQIAPANSGTVLVTQAKGTALSIASDANGNAFVGGYLNGNGNVTNAYALYITTGDAWSKLLSVPNLNGQAAFVGFDSLNNPVVCTNEYSGNDSTQNVIEKFDPNGTMKWKQTFTGLSSTTPVANASGFAIDKYGDCYLSGSSVFSGTFPRAAYMIKYNSAGQQMFLGYHGVSGMEEIPLSLAIAPSGDMLTTGLQQEGVHNQSSLIVEHWAQAPIANFDSYKTLKNVTLTVNAPGVLANDTFATGATVTLKDNVSHGSLSLHTDGSFTYVPTAGFTGTDTFTYTAQKAAGGVSNVSTVTITVT